MGWIVGRRPLAAIFGLALILAPGARQALADPRLPAGLLTVYCENDPPNQYFGKDGRLTGYSVDIVREIQKRVGTKEPIIMIPWARGYEEIQGRPGVVLFSMTRTEERDPLFLWVGPILETTYGLYARRDSTLTLGNLDEAKSLRSIGVYKDDARDLILTKAGFTNLSRVTDNLTNVRKLMAGRLDAFAESSIQVAADTTAAGFHPEDLKELIAFKRVQLYIAMSKGTSAMAAEAWSGALAAMKADGSLATILAKYYPGVPPPGPAIPFR